MALAVPSGTSGTYGAPYFDDAFPGTTLNAANWNSFMTSNAGGPWTGFGSSLGSPNAAQIVVSNGLSLNANKVGGNWQLGYICGYGLAAQLLKSGVIVVSFFSEDVTTGHWPGIWMLPASNSGLTADGYEFDLYEGGMLNYPPNFVSGGNALNTVCNTTQHVGQSNGNGVEYGQEATTALNAGWHTIAVEKIMGKSYQVWLDGVAQPKITSNVDSFGMQLILGQQLYDNSDVWHSPSSSSTPNATLQIGEVTMYYSGAAPSSAPTFTAANAPSAATIGTPYTFTFAATGSPTFSVTSGTLPQGLALNSATGVLSGTPSAPTGTSTFVVTATNSVGSAHTATLSITVAAGGSGAVPVFTADTPATTANVGTPVNYTFAATNSATFSVSSGTIPAGLSLNATTGVLSGTPTTATSYSFVVTATNSSGNVSSGTITIVVSAAITPGPTGGAAVGPLLGGFLLGGGYGSVGGGQVANAPLAPTLDAPIYSYMDVSGGVTFTYTYHAGKSRLAEIDYCFRMKRANAASYMYWNVATQAWQSSVCFNPSSTLDANANSVTIPTSAFFNNGFSYNWSFCSEQVDGPVGTFAVDASLVAQAKPLVSMQALVAGASSFTEIIWQWKPPTGATGQAFRVIIESGGYSTVPGSGTVVADSNDEGYGLPGGVVGPSGQITGSWTPSYPMPNNVNLRAFLQITETGSETSDWVYVTFELVNVTPQTPVVTAENGFDPNGVPAMVLTVNGSDNVLSLADSVSPTGSGVGSWTAGAGTALSTSTTSDGFGLVLTGL